MIYAANITTEIDLYPKTSPKKTVMKVTRGLVYKVEFYFAYGSAGLAGVAVFDGLYQVWPSSIGVFFLGDAQLISFDDLYLKDTAPYELQVYTYNEDTLYPHSIGVRIGLVSSDAFQTRFLPHRGYDYFTRLIAQLQEEKAEQAKAQREVIEETAFEWLLRQEIEGQS